MALWFTIGLHPLVQLEKEVINSKCSKYVLQWYRVVCIPGQFTLVG